MYVPVDPPFGRQISGLPGLCLVVIEGKSRLLIIFYNPFPQNVAEEGKPTKKSSLVKYYNLAMHINAWILWGY